MIWHKNVYSEEALEEMQKEAEERIRNMQRRARLLSGIPENIREESDYDTHENPTMSTDNPPLSTKQNCPLPSRQNRGPFSGIADFLNTLEPGSDRLVVLALLWILWNENADRKLLIALLWLLI